MIDTTQGLQKLEQLFRFCQSTHARAGEMPKYQNDTSEGSQFPMRARVRVSVFCVSF